MNASFLSGTFLHIPCSHIAHICRNRQIQFLLFQLLSIAECVKVIKDSFITVANDFGFTVENAPRFTAFATTEDRLNWHLPGEHRPMYAFYDQGNIVGYYSLLLQDNNECELNNLCVSPAYRHKGIGEELLKNAFNVAKDLGYVKISIGIVEENEVLKKWYENVRTLP